MSNNRIFKIATIGLSEKERIVLKSMFGVTTQRSRAYRIVESSESAQADIAMVDADNPDVLGWWKAKNANGHTVPTISVGSQASDDAEEAFILRPITLSKVTGVLDQLTIKALKYVPELLINDDAADTIVEEHLSKAAESVAKCGYMALVIDDSLALRKYMEIELNLFGITVHFAETGEQALELARVQQYDMVFVDVILPGIDGYQVCKTLKSDKRYTKTPVGMLTGKGSAIDKVRGTMAGCDFYLAKPVKPEAVHAVIRKSLPGLDNPGSAQLGIINRSGSSDDNVA